MYAFSVELKNCDFATAVDKVKAALTASKMGVISEINVAAILQKKLGIDYPDYCMLGTCAASLAKQVLDADPDAGALFPCNIIVRPVADGTVVTFMHPQTVFALANNAVINQVADKAMLMLTEVKNRLEQE